MIRRKSTRRRVALRAARGRPPTSTPSSGTYSLLTRDRRLGWVVRVGDRAPFTWWFGPVCGTGEASGRFLSRQVAVFDWPEDARGAMRSVGWQPGAGDARIVPLAAARAEVADEDDYLGPRQYRLAL